MKTITGALIGLLLISTVLLSACSKDTGGQAQPTTTATAVTTTTATPGPPSGGGGGGGGNGSNGGMPRPPAGAGNGSGTTAPLSTPNPGGAKEYNIEQAISDQAQQSTIAFDALGFITGNLCSDSFLPPGKAVTGAGPPW